MGQKGGKIRIHMSLVQVPLCVDSVSPACFDFWAIGCSLKMVECNTVISSLSKGKDLGKRSHMEWSAVILFPLHLNICLQGEHLGNLTKLMKLLCKS